MINCNAADVRAPTSTSTSISIRIRICDREQMARLLLAIACNGLDGIRSSGRAGARARARGGQLIAIECACARERSRGMTFFRSKLQPRNVCKRVIRTTNRRRARSQRNIDKTRERETETQGKEERREQTNKTKGEDAAGIFRRTAGSSRSLLLSDMLNRIKELSHGRHEFAALHHVGRGRQGHAHLVQLGAQGLMRGGQHRVQIGHIG